MIVCLSEVCCHILYLNESQFQILKQRRQRRPYYRRKLDTHITKTRMTESAKWEAYQQHQHYVSAFLLGVLGMGPEMHV
jgi:tRNA A-37 threonylcarbamoyl transferase component Bud32